MNHLTCMRLAINELLHAYEAAQRNNESKKTAKEQCEAAIKLIEKAIKQIK